ncbi:MAG TPA: hypothetical protein PLA90_11655 [Candidatus Sumerlaeota bacterium]|nr:hypothetical protein [Candidatus Sumerlaeota bacterium]HPS02189.1 hypothetical protein [Candidatus Sumerlaeota bacterium]
MKKTKAIRAPWAAALAVGALALAPLALWAQAPGAADPEAPPIPPPPVVTAPQATPTPALPERVSDPAPVSVAPGVTLPKIPAQPVAANGGAKTRRSGPATAAVKPGTPAAASVKPQAGAPQPAGSDPGLAAALQDLLDRAKLPKFQFQDTGQRDPMLVPWSRLRVEANRCYSLAEAAFAAGNLDEAQKQYEAVLGIDQQMREEGYVLEAMDKLVEDAQAGYRAVLEEKLKQREAAATGPGGEKTMTALPDEIRSATENGIIYNPADKTCMVGGVLLKEGQKYPGYENVLVQRIEKDKIVYKVGDKEFETPVKDPTQEGEKPKP